MNDMAQLKVPPHSIEAEQAVLAALMMDGSRWDVVAEVLQPEDFYRREHRVMYEAMQRQAADRKPIDVITLSEALRNAGQLQEAGGVDYLAELLGSNQSAANIVAYAKIVHERAVLRHLISVGHGIADSGYNPDGRDSLTLVTDAQNAVARIADSMATSEADEPHSLDDCLRETINILQTNWDNAGKLIGLSTGFTDIDARTCGLIRGDVIVIAGRPSQGKTTLAMNIAENVALAGGFVVVFSLEMPRQSLTQRMLASIAKVDHTKLRKGELDADGFDRVSAAAVRLKGRALYIDDRAGLTSKQLLSRARRIAKRMGRRVDLIVVDYLQLLADKGEGESRVGEISRNMKALAREINAPALILSQLNRGLENRPNKRPLMSDLRDSGSIEQDADLICMMYRDEVYDENTQHKGLAEVIWRKYRNGEIGTDILASRLDQCRFENSTVRHIEHRYQPPKKTRSRYEPD